MTYISFTEKYCEAIFDCLTQSILKHKTLHVCQKIDKVHNVWRKSILGFEIENDTIKCGNKLIIHTNEDRFIEKEIIEIQINGKTYTEVMVTDKTDIAIKIDENINKKQSFYLVKK